MDRAEITQAGRGMTKPCQPEPSGICGECAKDADCWSGEMDKWEQVAREMIAKASRRCRDDWRIDITELLRQCEADTIRRCAEEASDWETGQGAERAILALLPKESAQ